MEPRRRNLIIAAVGALLVIAFLVWLFAGRNSTNEDALGDNLSASSSRGDPEKLCASKATYDLIKRELFRRASSVRGSDQAAYDKLAAFAVVRMERPVMESQDSDTGLVHCSGSLSLDLPPGVQVAGGRRTLVADVDYTVQAAADGSGNVVTLANAEPIITPLATLARTAQSQEPDAMPGNEMMPEDDGSEPQPPVIAVPDPSVPSGVSVRSDTASPSFDCDNARTRGEIAVCGSAGLAALDRQMAAQFGRALSNAAPEQRALLQQTRARFLRYRDSCRSDDCIADSYRGRIAEIRDIMAGRWTAPQ